MKFALGILCAFMLCANLQAQVVGHVGRGRNGGVTLTPRGVSFKGNPAISKNTFKIEQKSLELTLQKAYEILRDTNVITGATYKDEHSIPSQSAALASIVYYPNRLSAQVKIRELFKNAKFPEGKIYALMAAKFLIDAPAYAKMLESFEQPKTVNVIYEITLRQIPPAEMLKIYAANTPLFLPSKAVMNPKTQIVVGSADGSPFIAEPMPSVIIVPNVD